MKKLYDIPKNRNAGVYAIINTDKNRIYVGEAVDMEYRCRVHFSKLANNKHNNIKMQKDFNQGNQFKVVYLCENKEKQMTKDERKRLEAYYYCCLKSRWIKLYNSPKTDYASVFFFWESRRNRDIQRIIDRLNNK